MASSLIQSDADHTQTVWVQYLHVTQSREGAFVLGILVVQKYNQQHISACITAVHSALASTHPSQSGGILTLSTQDVEQKLKGKEWF